MSKGSIDSNSVAPDIFGSQHLVSWSTKRPIVTGEFLDLNGDSWTSSMADMLEALMLDGKVALVTGAGRGIGRSAALIMAAMGADLAVVSRTRSELDEVVSSIEKLGRRGLGVECDLAMVGAPTRIIEACISHFGRLDILVNNAGMVIRKRAEEILPKDWDVILELNIKATAEMCRLALPHLRRNANAAIINMSSITGQVGTPLRAAYAATKAAIIGYTRVLAKELAPEGIRVNAVQPGFIDTDFVRPFLSDEPDQMADVLKHIPLGRMGTPDEAAWPIVFLASPAASYITGQSIVIDGGWMLF
jgi:NAD(P)-dependent dehydrogenase (short-subunit alcohol dehydrogenase family)